MSEVAIELKNVHKLFGNNAALNGLDLAVKKGQIFALLGHNGAGKTTTLRIILGLLEINEGEVKVFGKNPLETGEELRKISGVLSEDMGLYESLTVYDNLRFFAEIYQCKSSYYEKQIDVLLKEFEIYDKKFSVIKDFSLGMKKKVALIRTILHNPQLVLLDEPTNGLDPISIQKFHRIIREMADKNGTTFVITTHNLDEVRKICDEIVIVRQGKNIYNKDLSKDDLCDICETRICCMKNLNEYDVDLPSILEAVDVNLSYCLKENMIVLKTIDKDKIAEVIKNLIRHDILVYEAVKDEFDLEKIYIQTEAGEKS